MKKKLTIIGLLLVIGILIIGFFIFKKNNQGIINVSVIPNTEEPDNKNKHEELEYENEDEDENEDENEDKDENEDETKTKDKNDKRTKNNSKILAQLQDEDFWNKKIEEIINKKLFGERGEIEILGYGLLCEQWKEYQQDLSQCEYTVGFSNKVENWNGGNTLYDVYSNHGSAGSIWGFNYGGASIEIAMNDIGNGGVFYRDGTNLKVNNDDGTATYYTYKIDGDTGKILDKTKKIIVNRNTARDIIARDAGVDKDVVDPILRIEEGIYECDFSYKGHTYDYKINAKDGTIINGGDEIDIGEDAAMEIATKDAGIDGKDLMLEEDHGHMFTYLFPHTEKIGTGNSALYRVAITTNKDKYYLYDISAFDGRILSSNFGEKFVIYDKKGNSNDLTYRIESAFPKKQNLDIKIDELKMDDIYEFKDLIYLWVKFEGDKIVDWSIIDKYSDKNLDKKTKKELDELYNFESHYKIKDMDIFMGKKINLSELKENIIYKYSLPKGDYSDIEIVNDLGEDIIVYENREDPRYKDKTIKYTAKPYLKDGYTRGSRGYYYHDGREVLYIMYKKASTKDLLKVINEDEITFLSKFNIGYEISSKERVYGKIPGENYLYNDTDNSLTVLITNEIGSKVETMEVTIEPGKIVHCSEYADSVTILN